MSNVSETERIRRNLHALYKAGGWVHINMKQSNPKRNLNNVSAQIKGVYTHIFQIEESSGGAPKTHTLPYTDVLVKQIEILELDTI